MKELKYLNKYLLKYKKSLFLGTLFIIISNILAVFPAKFFGKAIDSAISGIKIYLQNPDSDTSSIKENLIFYAIIIILASVIKGIVSFFMRKTIIISSRKIEYELKNEIYSHYQKLDISFYKKNKIGDLMSRISEDVSNVRMYLGPAIMYSINLLIMFIIILYQMININLELALYTLLTMPILSILIYKISKKIRIETIKRQELISKLTSFVQESISGIRVIKSFSLEKITLGKYEDIVEKTRQKDIDLIKIRAFFFPSMQFFMGLGLLIILYIGSQKVQANLISIGEITEFIIYLGMMSWPVTAIGWVTNIIQQAEASQKRINQFLKTKSEIKNYTKKTTPINGKIEFKNVSFTYKNTDIKAINNLSFVINSGEKTIITGKIGTGKTTIIQLLQRIYDIEKGEILIDDTPIKDLNLKDLRQSISYSPQEPFLFSDTIENNISFHGSNNIDSEKIIKCAKLAGVHKDIIAFENGYKSKLGERGVSISGGQKQRISLARALYKNHKILILDDSLSAVDTKTEKIILDNILSKNNDKTVIMITHRIHKNYNFDRVIKL